MIAETGNSGCTYFHTKMIEYFIYNLALIWNLNQRNIDNFWNWGFIFHSVWHFFQLWTKIFAFCKCCDKNKNNELNCLPIKSEHNICQHTYGKSKIFRVTFWLIMILFFCIHPHCLNFVYPQIHIIKMYFFQNW